MKLKIENNSSHSINQAIIMIIASNTKAQANVLLKPYGIKIVSSTKADDTRLVILADI